MCSYNMYHVRQKKKKYVGTYVTRVISPLRSFRLSTPVRPSHINRQKAGVISAILFYKPIFLPFRLQGVDVFYTVTRECM